MMTNSEILETQQVDQLLSRARIAQQAYALGDQQTFDRVALAVGWALMQPEHNRELSQEAVRTTGLGNFDDKMTKNHRKTLGLLRDIKGVQTCGIIEDDPVLGITKIARPIGVIGAVVPSTNPVATPTNNIINALKCGNAIVLSPSPKGVEVCALLLKYIHLELAKLDISADLVQMLPSPSSKIKTQHLMENVDLLIVTGSQDNVRRAYRSGTPAIGVGAGNVVVIIDETTDLNTAAKKISASKCFDNATSCSSENALVVLEEIYDDTLEALHKAGGRMLNDVDADKLKSTLFQEKGLHRQMIARDLPELLRVADITLDQPEGAEFVIIPARAIGKEFPESGEKMSRVLSLYRAKDFSEAKQISLEIMHYIGAGHSIGIHSENGDRIMQLAQEMPTSRVIVNQAHCFATGGAFNNGMKFSLSMGCGSWGGNSIDDNLHYRHFMNTTKIVREIPNNEPTLEDIFEDYWSYIAR